MQVNEENGIKQNEREFLDERTVWLKITKEKEKELWQLQTKSLVKLKFFPEMKKSKENVKAEGSGKRMRQRN